MDAAGSTLDCQDAPTCRLLVQAQAIAAMVKSNLAYLRFLYIRLPLKRLQRVPS